MFSVYSDFFSLDCFDFVMATRRSQISLKPKTFHRWNNLFHCRSYKKYFEVISFENKRQIKMHFLTFLPAVLAVFHISPYTDRIRSVLGVNKNSLRILSWDAQPLAIPSNFFLRKIKTNRLDGNVMYNPQNGLLVIDGAVVYSFSHHDSEVLTNLDKVPQHFEQTKKITHWSIIPISSIDGEIDPNRCYSYNPTAFLELWRTSMTNDYPEEQFILYSHKYKECLDNLQRIEKNALFGLSNMPREPVLIKNNGYCMTLVENQPDGIQYMRTSDRRFFSSVDLSQPDPEKQFFKEYSTSNHIEPEIYDKYASMRLRMQACINSQDQLFYIWNDEDICAQPNVYSQEMIS